MSAEYVEKADERESAQAPEFALESGVIAIFDASLPIDAHNGNAAKVVHIESKPREGKTGRALAQYAMDVVYLNVENVPRVEDGGYAPLPAHPDIIFDSAWLFITDEFNTDPRLGAVELERGCATIMQEGRYAPFGSAHNPDRFTFPRYVPKTWFAAAIAGDQLYIANIGPEPLILTGRPIGFQELVQPEPEAPLPSELCEQAGK